MRFKLLTACLEDAYPRRCRKGRARLLESEEVAAVREKVEASEPGCVAFLFGRSPDRKTVRVRVEGIRPSFFAGGGGAARPRSRGGGIEDGGFEPSRPGRRRRHEYLEASYPSLAAEASTRGHKMAGLRQKERRAEEEAASIRADVMAMKREAMRGGKGDAEGCAAAWARLAEIEEGELPRLRRLLSQEPEAGGAPPGPAPRPAHEAFVEPLTRFFYEEGIGPSRWVEVAERGRSSRVTSRDIEVRARRGELVRGQEEEWLREPS